MDWNAAGENVERSGCFRAILREERKSVAFCEYGERRRFCADWNDARENVERSGCFRAFLREERKSVAFCEYGGRRRFCVDWNDAGENVERSGCFRAFSPRREEKRGVLRVWGAADGSARIGTMRGRTLSVPAAFALFLREERKSVAFCEYGERRMVLRGLERGGGER